MSGLRISMEKSTIYYAGLEENAVQTMETRFPFTTGALPVRYLGLPLLTKRMTQSDYESLLEKIRKQIGSWRARFLSMAGRLQLINSSLVSLINFWLSAFRLPSECITEIEKLLSAFLWSGPDLNPRKAKVSWEVVCRKKQEGGLGVRSLKEVNVVCCLKLIWRIISNQTSLWTTWIKTYLIRKGNFWSIGETNLGSWMWRKLLKYRDLAKQFHRVKVQSGHNTSFWYDNWSTLGRLMDLTGERGTTDMGIAADTSVAVALNRRHRRRHRTDLLRSIEHQLTNLRDRGPVTTADVALWQSKANTYKNKFKASNTWNLIRRTHPQVDWYNGVWFSHHTPKFAFLTWLAINNRLSTGDRMQTWNTGTSSVCVFCNQALETRNHIFFSCVFSTTIWTQLTTKLLGTHFSTDWGDLLNLLKDTSHGNTHLFIVRYVFQSAIHLIWRERNARRHGDAPLPPTHLLSLIDKQIRNRLSSIRALGDHRYDDGLELWFATRT